MSSPLDDALGAAERRRAAEAEALASARRVMLEAKPRFEELVADFLGRMAKAGNPGTQKLATPRGRFSPFSKKRQIWVLSTSSITKGARAVKLTVDGEISSEPSWKTKDGWVDFRAPPVLLEPWRIDNLAKSMARILTQTGAVDDRRT